MDLSELKDHIRHYLTGIEEEDFADRLSPAQIASIEKGLQQIKEGRTVPHEEVRKRYERWL